MSDQQTLFDDPTIAREERELFGDQLRPERMNFDAQGDYLHGYFRGVERDVDLKTGYASVDIWTVEGVSGVQKAGTQRIRKGVLYAVAVMHATLKNRLAEVDPEPADGERIAIRRDRDFVSNVEGPSYGKTLVAYQVVLPDRAALGDAPADDAKTSKAGK